MLHTSLKVLEDAAVRSDARSLTWKALFVKVLSVLVDIECNQMQTMQFAGHSECQTIQNVENIKNKKIQGAG